MEFPLTEKYLKELGFEIENEVVQYLEKNKKVASGKLINSVETYIAPSENGVKLYIRYIDYGKFVISGRKAGSKAPPLYPIKKWLGIKKPELKGKKNLNKLNNLAFLISRSIASKGIKPYNFKKFYDNKMEDVIIQNKISELLQLDFENFFKKEI